MDLSYLENDEGEFTEIDLSSDGTIKLPKNGRIALIDADTIAYAVCSVQEVAEDLLPRDMYTDKEWADIINSYNYDADKHCIYSIDMDLALESAVSKITRILDHTGCVDAELHFTSGKNNYRYSIYPAYKGNRTNRVPVGLKELKELLCTKYRGYLHTLWEADEVVVALRKSSDMYILCAVDKDVLNSVEGTHFNYYEKINQYEPEKSIFMQFVTVDKYTALTWVYVQTLSGDTVDNVKGCKGIGITKAPNIVNGLLDLSIAESNTVEVKYHNMIHDILLRKIGEFFEEKGMTKEDAIRDFNIVRVDTIDILLNPNTLETSFKLSYDMLEYMESKAIDVSKWR